MTRVELSPKRIRALAGGAVVADSRTAMLVWEKPQYPTYYLPRDDVRAELVATGRVERHAVLGDGQLYDVEVAGRTLHGAAITYPDSEAAVLRDLVRLDWQAMQEWLEEDEPVYVHPRDPYKRVDVLASSRHAQFVVDEQVVADSMQPRILFETGLVPRYYLPVADVHTGLLRPSRTMSQCPYKGTATYWSVQVGEALHHDLAWMYRTPAAEAQKVAGLIAFYQERVDLHLDGELQRRPRTPFV